MPQPVPDYTLTLNKGLSTLLEMYDGYYTESLEAKQSRNGNSVHPEDARRCKEYLDDMRHFIDLWVQRRRQDKPRTSGTLYEMPDLERPHRETSQNPLWFHHMTEMYDMRDEIRCSQSRNWVQGFHPNDVARWKEYFEDEAAYLDVVVQDIEPIDRPESTANYEHFTSDKTDYSPGYSGVANRGGSNSTR